MPCTYFLWGLTYQQNQRRDRTDSGGGIAAFMRTDIPAKPEEGPYR
jgi:hypothetical protein